MIQGTNKFYIDALGCFTNRVDATRVQNFFLANGWIQTDQIREASLVVLMTCGFTQASEDYNISKIEELKQKMKPGAQMIVGGCLTAINKERVKTVHDGYTLTPRTLTKLDDYIPAKTLMGAIDSRTDDPENPGLKVIRVSTGCMGACTYCAIPFANGRTQSRSIDNIIRDIKKSVDEGYTAVKLVSEDVGAYGQDLGVSVVDLLKEILYNDDNINVLVDSINPNWLYHYKSEMMDLFSSDRIEKNFYIPVQSGSDRILKLMRRAYTVEEAKLALFTLYESFPEVRISCDFLVGFPTETDTDFEETRLLLNEYNYDFIQIFMYEDRPGTKASKFKDKISVDIKEKRRTILFQDFLKNYLKKHNVSDMKDLMMVLKLQNIPVNFNVQM